MSKSLETSLLKPFPRIGLLAAAIVLVVTANLMAQSAYQVGNLVSDVPGLAQITDPQLQNPWGMSLSATSPFWIADNASGLATLYTGDVGGSPITKVPLVLTIPHPPGFLRGTPTGTVFNSTTDFVFSDRSGPGPAQFIFAALDGTISAWKSGTSAVIVAETVFGVYGLAIGGNDSGNFLYAANAVAGTIEVFDGNFNRVMLDGGFVDPDLPAGFRPFNIQNLNGELYVAYRNRSDPEHGGVVDVFDPSGNFTRRISSGASLNAPWGLALAPGDFGDFSGALLVGNFGLDDGRINAFDPATGDYLGHLNGPDGNPLALERLWTLAFGNGGSGGDTNVLYFTAGINREQDGLFGRISVSSGAGRSRLSQGAARK